MADEKTFVQKWKEIFIAKKEKLVEYIKKNGLKGLFIRSSYGLKDRVKLLLPYGKVIEKIYLLIFLIVFIVLFLQEGSIVTEAIAALMVIGTGGLFILRSLRKKVYFPKKYTLFFSLFLLITIISTLLSNNIYTSLLRYNELFCAGLIGVLGYDIIYGRYSRRWILNAFSAALVGVLVYGMFRYIFDRNSLILPLGFPVYIGAMILLLFPFCLSSTLKTKKIKRIAFLFADGIILLATILTFSHMIYVLVGIEVLLFIYFNAFLGKRPLRKKTFYMPILILLILVTLLASVLHFKTSGTVAFTLSSFADRYLPIQLHMDILKQGWNVFKAMPLLGSGLDTFRIISQFYQGSAWHLAYYLHNEYAEFFVTTGILGGSIFLIFVGYILYEICNKKHFKKIFKQQSAETFELTVGILAVFILAFYYPVLHVPVIVFTLFLFIGILLKSLQIDGFKKYYLGDLSIGVINGFAIFFILLCGYFYVTQFQFNKIQSQLSTSQSPNLPSIEKSLEQLVKINPINSQYATVLSQVYLADNKFQQAITNNALAMKYDKKSAYLTYSQALIYYFKGDKNKAASIEKLLLKQVPYADPSFYLLQLQNDQADQTVFRMDLQNVYKKFPITDYYTRYQPIWSTLGYSDSLSKVYFELGLITNDQSYFTKAEQIDPQGFGMTGQ